jgi:hypothetical protein
LQGAADGDGAGVEVDVAPAQAERFALAQAEGEPDEPGEGPGVAAPGGGAASGLSSVAANIAGVSSRQMLDGLVARERDPAVLADLAKSKLRRPIPDLTEALIGRCDDHHALRVEAMLTRLNHVEAARATVNVQITVEMAPWEHQLQLLRTHSRSGAIRGFDSRFFCPRRHICGPAPGDYRSPTAAPRIEA